MNADLHLDKFVSSFVVKSRRQRWRQLLSKRGKKAYHQGLDRDAIFSIEPGRLALFFFHEGELLLCQRSAHDQTG